MWQVVLGRIVSGAGTSGMTALVSVLITDLLPLREVAQWRAYVNVIATTGRSIGGPLGGWLADVVGWRWSFLGQAPILGIAIVLSSIYLPGPPSIPSSPGSNLSKFSRIDVKGSLFFASSVVSLLLPLELGGTRFPWTSPTILSLFALSFILLFLFIRVERHHAEPILPLEIFHRRDAVLSFLIMGLQTAAQISVRPFSLPCCLTLTPSAHVLRTSLLPSNAAPLQHRLGPASCARRSRQRYRWAHRRDSDQADGTVQSADDLCRDVFVVLLPPADVSLAW